MSNEDDAVDSRKDDRTECDYPKDLPSGRKDDSTHDQPVRNRTARTATTSLSFQNDD